MAITNADILGWLNANPNANDDLIYKTMIEAGVTTEQYLSATGKPLPRSTATPKVTNADILGWLNANPGASPALINETMKAAGVTSAQYQSATGLALPTVSAPAPMPLPVSVANTQPPVPQVSTPQAAPTPPSEGLLGGAVQAPPVSTVTNADILGWLNANPNATPALINETMKAAGVSANQYLSATGKPLAGSQATGVGSILQATGVSGIFPEGMLTNTQLTSVPDNPLVKLYQDTLGRTPSKEEIEGWGFGKTIDAQELDRFLGAARREAVETMPKTGAVGNIANQILAQGTTDKWAGEGFGSPQKNAYDMAVMLAGQGFTDINQFGERTNPEGKKEYFNKATGEAVKSYYDRAGDDIWGGTFTGKDSTAYGVSFDPAGKPLFYSKSGGDSADVPSWVAPALIIGAAYFGLDASGLLSGLGGTGAAGAAGTAATAGAGSLTAGITLADIIAAEALLPGLTAAQAAGLGAAGLGSLTAGITPAQIAAAEAGLTGSGLLSGSLTAGLTATDIAALEAGLPTAGSLTSGITAAQIAAGESALPGAGLGAPSLVGGVAGTGALPATVQNALAKAGVSTAVNSLLGTGGTSNIPNLISGGLGTAGNLLQMQESREAAQRAQARIDAETAAAKASAAFRPIGMTTRFGTSQFQVDPVTGQLTSAGYTLSPEAKAQQDRFMALSQQGLTQAEQAQGQFAPLQTGAQRLFGLGNQYLAQSPEAVAQNYLNQQMALLQPGRELELATLQNRLQQQGRGGLSVAQGGTLGATTPELQALYNARAQQEAQLAANAQQYGQQQVAFGAGLLGTGAQTMGQYYGGQQAAYAPYTTAMGQVQALEGLGQQPFTMGAQLGQTASTAGARAGQLGLEGARLSTALATGADATRNLGAQSLIAAGNPNAQFGQAIGSALGGLFGGIPQASLTTGFEPSSIVAAEYGLPVDYSFLYS
jgi:hypothetical protein